MKLTTSFSWTPRERRERRTHSGSVEDLGVDAEDLEEEGLAVVEVLAVVEDSVEAEDLVEEDVLVVDAGVELSETEIVSIDDDR